MPSRKVAKPKKNQNKKAAAKPKRTAANKRTKQTPAKQTHTRRSGSARITGVQRTNSKTTMTPRARALVRVSREDVEPRDVRQAWRKRMGSSNEGRYPNLPNSDFCGSAGGASPHSFPVQDRAHFHAALARAHFAPNPAGIRRCAYAKARANGWLSGQVKTNVKTNKRASS